MKGRSILTLNEQLDEAKRRKDITKSYIADLEFIDSLERGVIKLVDKFFSIDKDIIEYTNSNFEIVCISDFKEIIKLI